MFSSWSGNRCHTSLEHVTVDIQLSVLGRCSLCDKLYGFNYIQCRASSNVLKFVLLSKIGCKCMDILISELFLVSKEVSIGCPSPVYTRRHFSSLEDKEYVFNFISVHWMSAVYEGMNTYFMFANLHPGWFCVSSWHKLESLEWEELQLRQCFHEIQL